MPTTADVRSAAIEYMIDLASDRDETGEVTPQSQELMDAVGELLANPEELASVAGVSKFSDTPTPTDQVALAGPDGRRAAELLRDAKDRGALILNHLAARAVTRLLDQEHPQRAKHLFDDDELQAFTDALAAVNSTSNLLGRSRIRERARQASLRFHQHVEFSESDSFVSFAEPPQPLPPQNAIDYFKNLVPELGYLRPDQFAEGMVRQAFTLAAATDEVILNKVKDLIQTGIETGKVSDKTRLIQTILDDAGVSPRNPQYSQMVLRTNMMDSYNEGAQKELAEPEMKEMFPVWQWLGIDDGRQRHSHAVHFNKYFPSTVTFQEVRDSVKGEFDGYNDRCTPAPVDRYTWDELQANGAQIETSW